MELLIPASEPVDCGEALIWAANHKHFRCVGLLMSVGDSKADNSRALRWSAGRGHSECVALLLPASDPRAKGGEGFDAAGHATRRGHLDLAAMIESFIEGKDLRETVAAGQSSRRAASL